MITSGFFNSINHDRVYNAEEMSNYFEGLITNGIYEMIGGAFAVTAAETTEKLAVNVATGRAMIDCRWIRSDSVLNITLDDADLQLDRIDSIAIKLDLTNREMTVELIKGDLASNPVPPTLENTDTTKYLRVANISVPHNTVFLVQARIFDRRGTSDCPYVTTLGRGSGMSFQKLQNSYDVTAEQSSYYIHIQDYDKSTDILFVYLNGILLTEDVEFDVVNNGYNAYIQLKDNRTIKVGNNLTFVALKSR